MRSKIQSTNISIESIELSRRWRLAISVCSNENFDRFFFQNLALVVSILNLINEHSLVNWLIWSINIFIWFEINSRKIEEFQLFIFQTRQLDLGSNNISNLHEFGELQLPNLGVLSLASNQVESIFSSQIVYFVVW